MFKKIAVFLFSVSLVSFSFSLCYGMGGGAPSETQQSQEIIVPANEPAASDKRVEEIDRARAEIKQERAELEKVEKYLWALDGKIADARKTGNSKKLLELKELEMDTLSRAKLINGSIDKKMETYPELKVSEALEAAKEKPAAQQQPQMVAPIIPVEQAAEQPPVQAAPKPVYRQQAVSSPIVYHEVEVGDTLFSISRKYFGTPSLYKIIAKENNIADPSALRQGMVLKIDLRWKGMAPTTGL